MAPVEHSSSRSYVSSTDGDGVRISATARLADIAAADALVRSSYSLLAAACEHEQAIADADATLADCIAPATTCVRVGDGVMCALNGSATCAARDPGSDLHSIFDGGPCRRANRSAAAVALVALEAELEIAAPDGNRMVSAEEFFALTDPNATAGRPTDLRVLSARVPPAAAGGFQRLSLSAGSDAGVSAICLAAVQRTDGDVRLVLGGVSPRPYRAYTSVEEETMAGGLDEEAIAGLADRALLDAEADPRSARKVDAAAGLLRDAIQEIASS